MKYAPCMDYLTFARTKSTSFVGKYTSTMLRIWLGFPCFKQRETSVNSGPQLVMVA